MSRGPLVVVGDLLLDREVVGVVERLCPEAPVPVLSERATHDRPGGAGLASLFAAATAAPQRRRGGREVVLVAAVSDDAAGERLRELLAGAGVRLVELPLAGPTPEKIRLRSGDHLLVRLDRGDAVGEVGALPPAAREAVRAARAVLVSDYGRGVCAQPELRELLSEQAHRVPVVWDPHPRGAPPVPAVRLATPNRTEAGELVAAYRRSGFGSGEWPLVTAALGRQPAGPYVNGGNGAGGGNGAAGANGANGGAGGNGIAVRNGAKANGGVPARNGNAAAGNGAAGGNGHRRAAEPVDDELADAANSAVRLRRVWSAGAVSVTLAERGAVLSDGVQPPLLVPTPFTARGDSCGAGDRFASAALTALADGAGVVEAVTAAVTAATGYVAAGGALGLHRGEPGVPEVAELAPRMAAADVREDR